jgi:hypothetical protein
MWMPFSAFSALVALGFPLPNSFPGGPAQAPDGKYGQETYNAVAKFQRREFPGKPGEWDGRCGKNTLSRMDALLPPGLTLAEEKAAIIAAAVSHSRASLRVVLRRMQSLEAAIDVADRSEGLNKLVATHALSQTFARDVAIIADKLITPLDPLSRQFRAALALAKALIQSNLNAASGVIDEDMVGRCTPTNFNPPMLVFAATTVTDPDPRVSVCRLFFQSNDDMKRDVITHEFFHLLLLQDMRLIKTTADALNDANTVAQVVAYMHDRTRTRDSSNLAQPPVTYPSP